MQLDNAGINKYHLSKDNHQTPVTRGFLFVGGLVDLEMSRRFTMIIMAILLFNQSLANRLHNATPKMILFIGNSMTFFNGGVDYHLEKFVSSAGFNVKCKSIVKGGATLEQHWKNTLVHDEIKKGIYDIIIFQENGTVLMRGADENFRIYITKFDSLAKSVSSRSLLFMQSLPKSRIKKWFLPRFIEDSINRFFEDLIYQDREELFNDISNALNIDYVNIAKSYNNSYRINPKVTLLLIDNHPNEFGTYLDVCMFYSFLWKKSPIGVDYIISDKITEKLKLHLQEIAWNSMVK